MNVDPFTAASPTFLAAKRLGVYTPPLMAGEVAEYRRRSGFFGSLLGLIFFMAAAFCGLVLWGAFA
jgi:hypothetical protein